MAVCPFFKMAVVHHLAFLGKYGIFSAEVVGSASMHQCSKFHANWQSCCRDMTIFDFSRWRPMRFRGPTCFTVPDIVLIGNCCYGDMAVFDLRWCHQLSGIFQNSVRFRGPIYVTVLNFVLIGQTFVELWTFSDFSKWRPFTILNF